MHCYCLSAPTSGVENAINQHRQKKNRMRQRERTRRLCSDPASVKIARVMKFLLEKGRCKKSEVLKGLALTKESLDPILQRLLELELVSAEAFRSKNGNMPGTWFSLRSDPCSA